MSEEESIPALYEMADDIMFGRNLSKFRIISFDVYDVSSLETSAPDCSKPVAVAAYCGRSGSVTFTYNDNDSIFIEIKKYLNNIKMRGQPGERDIAMYKVCYAATYSHLYSKDEFDKIVDLLIKMEDTYGVSILSRFHKKEKK
jgi:hypothetical protein